MLKPVAQERRNAASPSEDPAAPRQGPENAARTGGTGRPGGTAARIGRWKVEARALYLALRHPRVPWYVKAGLCLLVAYVFSPVDPLPDFVPVLGHLDELLLVPLGVALARRLIAPDVLAECRQQAAALEHKPRMAAGAVAVVLGWLILAALTGWLAWHAGVAGRLGGVP
ncbi:YkvA family protein [Thermaerobacter marianensis]|nr:YkvA family protein [Thermaerobacter marianensis]